MKIVFLTLINTAFQFIFFLGLLNLIFLYIFYGHKIYV